MQQYLIIACPEAKTLMDEHISCEWKKDDSWFVAQLNFESQNDKDQLFSAFKTRMQANMSLGMRDKSFRPKALFSDVDATLVPVESIELIADAKGCLEPVRKITRQAMSGAEPNFEKSLLERLAYLKGTALTDIEEIAHKVEHYPGVEHLVQWCDRIHIPFHMVSGGFTQMLDIYAKKFKIPHYHANTLEFKEGHMTGKITGTCVDGDEKNNWLKQRCMDIGCLPEEAIAIGDGANDLSMLKTSGLAIGFRPKKVLYESLDVINNTQDHLFHTRFLQLT